MRVTATPAWSRSPTRLLEGCVYVAALVWFVLSIRAQIGAEIADDAAFFLRYADNMLRGEFWVWNRGEAPIWGASAPLYPLLVAIPIAFGVPSVTALIWTGIITAAIALAFVGSTLARQVGLVAAIAFVLLMGRDAEAMYFASAGLETPLTYLLIAAGIGVLLLDAPSVAVGIVAGVLMVNKLDLVPVGGFLLAAYWLKRRSLPWRAVLVAAVIAAAWYAFAWAYFGAPVPNSFLTKSLHQQNMPHVIDWRWFGSTLTAGPRKWAAVLALAGVLTPARHRPLQLFLVGGLGIHLLAYTVKYPFEPYNWYAMPAVMMLCGLAALGAQAIADTVTAHIGDRVAVASAATVLVLFLPWLVLGRSHEAAITEMYKGYNSHQEADRAEAGRWVAAHTPRDARVLTCWGNPAYYSHRYVIDCSYLNRKFEATDPVARYRPEIVIMQSGAQPNPEFADGYQIVKVFDTTARAGGDYSFIVVAREDVLPRLTDIQPLRFPMAYITDVQPGDEFGTAHAQGRDVFVHPGRNTPTSFRFDVLRFASDARRPTVRLAVRMAPNVPRDAIERGAAHVGVTVYDGQTRIATASVDAAHPGLVQIDPRAHPQVRVVVDNAGNPDTDWTLLSFD